MSTQINSLSAIMPVILARALLTLRERCFMPRLVNSDYSIDAAKKGTTIDVPIPVAVGTKEVLAQANPDAPSSCTPTEVQIPLDQWRQNDPIGLTDRELCEIDANEHFLPMQMAEAVKALANEVNVFIMSKYKGEDRGIYGFIASPTAGVGAIIDPFCGTGTADTDGVSGATHAKKVLNQQLCPRIDRRGVLNFDAEANALDLAAFSDAEKIMSATVKIEGEIGRKFGIDWMADDHVPDHTAGGAYEGSPTALTVKVTEAAASVGLGLVDTGSTTQTIYRGDILTITHAAAPLDAQTYVVIGGAANINSEGYYGYIMNDDHSTAVEVGIYPALKVQAEAGDVVSLKNSHAVNLVFHRDAFAFATRPLLANSSQYALGNKMLTMQDPVTGLILRLEVSRQHKQTVWEFDILYGADLVRPDLAMRIAGAV